MQTRRQFVNGALGAATATLLPRSRALGANDRVRLGVIGSGNRATSVMGLFLGNPEVEVAAICDVWDEHLAKCREKIANRPADFKEYTDHRALLERKDLDAVLIGTPDHWHCPIVIDACRAGKDVYVEKPLSFTVAEGRDVIKIARDTNRVVQVGMQQRSGEHYREAKELYFDSGKIGKVTLARTWWHGNAWHLRKPPFTAKPAGLDWERFVGPRPKRPWDAHQFWNWRAYLDFGGGQITDLFTHWIDVVHWFMREDTPSAAVASGGVYQYKDGRTAPDTINVLLEYPGQWTATFEATLAPGGRGAAIEFVGTEGSLNITRGGYVWTPRQGERAERKAPPGDMTGAHVRNFLECMRSRQRPAGDVAIGHRSAVASHLGNIACVEKRRVRLDGTRDQVLPS